jgi:hypothetical protein
MFGNPTLKNSKNIGKGGRVPVHSQEFANTTPSKLRQRTSEENMHNILRLMTQGTLAIRLPMSTLYLVIGWESISGQLPDQDSDFQRESYLPNILSMGNRGPLDYLFVEGSSGEQPRGFKVPGHTIMYLGQSLFP